LRGIDMARTLAHGPEFHLRSLDGEPDSGLKLAVGAAQ